MRALLLLVAIIVAAAIVDAPPTSTESPPSIDIAEVGEGGVTGNGGIPDPVVLARTTQAQVEIPTPPASPATVVRVNSTAYCLTGRMANGQKAHAGAVGVPRRGRHGYFPMGTRLKVSDGPHGPGAIYVVSDRIGRGSQLDFAMPGNCRGARQWGRRNITVQVVE